MTMNDERVTNSGNTAAKNNDLATKIFGGSPLAVLGGWSWSRSWSGSSCRRSGSTRSTSCKASSGWSARSGTWASTRSAGCGATSCSAR